MKNSLYIILSISILFFGCKKSETEQALQQQEIQAESTTEQSEEPLPTARGTINFKDILKDVVSGLKTENSEVLNQYVDAESGLYYIISTQGIYSEIMKYTDFDEVFKDSEGTSEYEQNPLSYLLDYMNNVEMNELEIIDDNLLGQEACDFVEEGFFNDTQENNSKILTDIYNMNLERDGLAINPNELLELGDIQNKANKRFLINDGESTYVLYFANEDNQYKLLMMDMRECSM